MSGDNWKTLRVPPEAYDEAKEQKEEHGRTWGEQVVRDEDNAPRDVDALVDELKDELSMTADPGAPTSDADVERMMETLERIERAAGTVEERTGRIERAVEELGGNR